MRALKILALALCLPLPSRAAMRLLSASGDVKAGGKVLHPGDSVKANVEITLSTGTATFTTDAGRFMLKGPASFTPEKRSIRLSLGGLLSVLPRLSKRRFEVRTANSVAAVRGTDFYIEARTDDSTYICACKGKLEISGKNLEKGALESQHHTAVLIDTDGSKTSKSEAGLENHTDAELDELRDAEK